jgi:hypothetical protein
LTDWLTADVLAGISRLRGFLRGAAHAFAQTLGALSVQICKAGETERSLVLDFVAKA